MEVVVRPVREEDAAALHAIQLQAGVLPYILQLPSVRLAQAQRYLADLGPDMHYFVAEVEGTTVGYAGLRCAQGRLRHSGSLFVAVDPGSHGQGVGTALLRVIIDLADNWLMLERLELTVLGTNPRAQALYERMGFVAEGRKRGSVISAGRYVDEIAMARLRPGGLLAQAQQADVPS